MQIAVIAWHRFRALPIFLPGRRHLLLLRFSLLLAITAVLVTAPVRAGSVDLGWLVVLGFLVSIPAIHFLPRGTLEAAHVKFLVILADTFLLTFILTVSGLGSPRLYLFFFLMIGIISLGEGLFRILISAGFLTVVCFYGSLGWQESFAPLGQVPNPVLLPLFAVAALYYGYFVAEVRHREGLADQVRRERFELRSILSILEETNSTLDFHSIMHKTTVRMAEVLDSARVSIVLVNRERRECAVLTSSDDSRINRLPIELKKYPEIEKAMKTAGPVVIQDIEKSALVAPVRGDLRRLGFRSLLVIPLRYGEEIFGTICLRASRERTGFAADEIRFAQIVASAAANAVKNSLLFRSAREESLQHREKANQLQLLFDHLPDLIFFLDTDGRIVNLNRAATKRTGYRRDRVPGHDFTRLWNGPAGLAVVVEGLNNGESRDLGEVQLKCQDGPPIEARVRVSRLGTPNGPAQGYLGIAQDISSEKRAQAQLLHADRLTTVGELVATVAHELRNRLTGVLGFSQLVSIRNRDPELTRDLERIAASAEQCKKIVNDLLGFSKKADPDRRPLGVNGVLRKALDLLERQMEETGIAVTPTLERDLPFCLLDFQQIQQVFINILTNAQQAIAAGDPGGRIEVRTRRDGDAVVIEIEDDGPGMNREVVDRIFDPFFTTKPAEVGTGLGLSISYGIVQNHDGHIEVDSEPGRGTTFRIRLPVTAEAAPPAPPVEEVVATTGQRVLVVDDDPTIVELYMAILENQGHRVDTANNGLEACRKLDGNQYDLIISDLKMPKMNGLEFLKQVQSDHPAMAARFVFTTGDLNYMNSHEFIMLSDVPCLVKPLDIQEVERVVAKILAA